MQVAFGSGIIMDKVVGFEDDTLDRGVSKHGNHRQDPLDNFALFTA